ncbi:MAG: hypothetical protein ACJAWW_002755 [Sulfurimonas sp.]|jgi:hypothetical protein
MTKKEFINIFENGFELDSVKGSNSKLKCFVCHEKIELKKVNRKWKIRCKNKHTYKLIDYTIMHIMTRDGLLKKQLENLCMFNY